MGAVLMLPLTVVPQLVPGVGTASADCGPAAGAVQVAFATNGEETPTAADVRALVRTPLGNQDNGPTNIPQIARAIEMGWGVDTDLVSPDWFDSAWDRLRDPRECMHVMVWYGVVRGTAFYASKNNFGENHSVVLAGATDFSAVVADSLADGRNGVPKGPHRWPRDLIRRACGAVRVRRGGQITLLGNGFVIGGFARAAEVEPVELGDAMDNLFPDTVLAYGVSLKAGRRFYEDADLTVQQGTVSEAKTFGLLGAPVSRDLFRVANGDRGVFIKRGALKPRKLDVPIKVGK